MTSNRTGTKNWHGRGLKTQQKTIRRKYQGRRTSVSVLTNLEKKGSTANLGPVPPTPSPRALKFKGFVRRSSAKRAGVLHQKNEKKKPHRAGNQDHYGLTSE